MKKNKGITLIALIITIIVMLILVAVSVNILIKSNLIGNAEKTVNKYKTATEEEAKGGVITINGKKYNSIDDYTNRRSLKLKYQEKNGEIRVYCQGDFYDFVISKSKDEKEQGLAQELGKANINELIAEKYDNDRNAYEKALIELVNEIYENSEPKANVWDYEDALNLICIDAIEVDFFIEEYEDEINKNPNDYPDFSNVKITMPDNQTKEGTLAIYHTTTNGDYKFKAEGNGEQDELVVSINYPEKNIKIRIVEDKDIMSTVSSTEELATYLKQLPEGETKQYTFSSPDWKNIIFNGTLPDGATFGGGGKTESDAYVTYTINDDSYKLYYLDENDKLVVTNPFVEIQTKYTYYGVYTKKPNN